MNAQCNVYAPFTSTRKLTMHIAKRCPCVHVPRVTDIKAKSLEKKPNREIMTQWYLRRDAEYPICDTKKKRESNEIEQKNRLFVTNRY